MTMFKYAEHILNARKGQPSEREKEEEKLKECKSVELAASAKLKTFAMPTRTKRISYGTNGMEWNETERTSEEEKTITNVYSVQKW